MAKILLIEDEKVQRKNLSAYLTKQKYEVDSADCVKCANEMLKENAYQVIISDMKLEDGTGRDILEMANEYAPEAFFIIVTAFASFEDSVSLIKAGAYDYIQKPVNLDELDSKIRNALNMINKNRENVILRERIKRTSNPIIYKSETIERLIETAERMAQSKAPVLITGDSGTGKELFARMIHERSRMNEVFIGVNCGALNENLLESELFGHEKGSFTGADRQKPGRFEMADGGTIFLDEIGEISLNMQVKLLRVIQEGQFERVGGTKSIKTDVRIIAATNRNLEDEIKNSRFREDLYYRLNVLQLEIPPLRERKEDIEELTEYFIRKYAEENGKNINKISAPALNKLRTYSFPGNVRELQNIIQRAVILDNDNIIDSDDILLREITSGNAGTLPEAVREIETQWIIKAMKKSGNSANKAARLLGITPRMLRYKMEKYGINME